MVILIHVVEDYPINMESRITQSTSGEQGSVQEHLHGELPTGQCSFLQTVFNGMLFIVVSLNTLYDMNSFSINITNSMYIGVENNL